MTSRRERESNEFAAAQGLGMTLLEWLPMTPPRWEEDER
jgi:hypothetical protein